MDRHEKIDHIEFPAKDIETAKALLTWIHSQKYPSLSPST